MERERKTASWAVAAVMLIVLLPTIYVLSIGPAIWLHQQELISDRPIEVIYLPLEWAVDAFPRVTIPLVWYVGVWDGTEMDVPVSAPLPQPPVPPPPAQFAPYQQL